MRWNVQPYHRYLRVFRHRNGDRRRRHVHFVSSVHAFEEHCNARSPNVLSIDFFDTIVFRDCLSPDHIFWRVLASKAAKELQTRRVLGNP